MQFFAIEVIDPQPGKLMETCHHCQGKREMKTLETFTIYQMMCVCVCHQNTWTPKKIIKLSCTEKVAAFSVKIEA